MSRLTEPCCYEAIWVTHTHWDREWYLSLEQTRFRLVELFDRLLEMIKEEPAYSSFWLDGQTIPLDDYLAVWPERKEELAQRVREGKIRIGPWYVLADEHLISGEACLRNLLRGRRDSGQWGQWNPIGYLPDTFGHIDQMPQILRGFGISNAFFWRGYALDDLQGAETRWKGRDGSVVDAVCLVAGYSNARGFRAEDPEGSSDRLDQTLPILKKHCRSGVLLLMNGIDHALPTPRIRDTLHQFEKRFPELRVRHGSLDNYLGKIRPYCRRSKPLRGELFRVAGLDGCLSTRPQQKALNRRLENRLAHYAEPLVLRANAAGAGIPPGFLDRGWELLLQCHPHDTICGCHADSVARDMQSRLEQGLEIAEELEHRAVCALWGCRPGERSLKERHVLVLYNPLPWRREETSEYEIAVPPGTGSLIVRDESGCPLESRILACRPGFHTTYHDDKIPTRIPCLMMRVAICTGSLPPMGFRRLTVEPAKPPVFNILEASTEGEEKSATGAGMVVGGNVLENRALRAIIYPDATFDLFDKESDLFLPRIHRLQVESDHGDLYRFAPSLEGEVEAAGPGSWARRAGGTLFQSVVVKPCLSLRGQPFDVKAVFTLPEGKNRLEIRLEIHHTLRDFRLQAAFPGPWTGHGYAHTPFSLSPRRPVRVRETVWEGRDERLRLEATGQPMQFMAAFALPQKRALALYNRGLYEYTWEEQGCPCLTLMRAVGRITAEMKEHRAESAQVQGCQTFEYAVAMGSADNPSVALREAYEYNLPPAAHPIAPEGGARVGEGIELLDAHWIPSAFKQREDGRGHVIRFWNASETLRSGAIRIPPGYHRAIRARLDETPLREIPIRGCVLRLTARPYEVVTILLEAERFRSVRRTRARS